MYRRSIAIGFCLLALAITLRATGGVVTGATSPQQSAAPKQAAAPKAPPPPQVTPQVTSADYVGTDTCLTCHEGKDATLKGTKHDQAKNPRTPMAKEGCESCHGPGKKHSDDGSTPDFILSLKTKTMKAADISGTCLTCHNRGTHAGWEGGGHDRRNLSCATCHSVHSPKSPAHQLVKKTQTEVCATCHKTQVAKTERAVAHMPVREGKMSCSSCHNPHGSISNVKQLKTGSSVTELCVTCHTEMRGPVLWEHAPVRENCATCHDPHGSSNDRMLVARMPMLCQRCHVASRHPATLYDKDQITTNKSNRMFGRSCVNCHSNVHGSNHPSGQFFMR